LETKYILKYQKKILFYFLVLEKNSRVFRKELKSIDPRAIFLCTVLKQSNLRVAKERNASARPAPLASSEFYFVLQLQLSKRVFSGAFNSTLCVSGQKKISSTRKQRVDAKVLKQALRCYVATLNAK
jgi:hypothetical protein